jgi:uncharacterized membrane protein
MHAKAAITVLGSPEEVQRLWRSQDHTEGAVIKFKAAPGNRGTEVHVEVEEGGPLSKLLGSEPLPKVKDELRHFKQLAEAGEIARSDATPEGEAWERKLKQRPAQPLSEAELEKVGV